MNIYVCYMRFIQSDHFKKTLKCLQKQYATIYKYKCYTLVIISSTCWLIYTCSAIISHKALKHSVPGALIYSQVLNCFLSLKCRIIARCKCLPVSDVTGPEQCGRVDDGVPCCTCSVELWILTNQMTRQESTMRPTHHSHPIRIKGLVTLQDMQHSPLRKRNIRIWNMGKVRKQKGRKINVMMPFISDLTCLSCFALKTNKKYNHGMYYLIIISLLLLSLLLL